MKTIPTMVHVGANVDQANQVLVKLTDSILKIINTSAGDEVKKKALDMLSGAYEVRNVSIANCNFANTLKDL